MSVGSKSEVRHTSPKMQPLEEFFIKVIETGLERMGQATFFFITKSTTQKEDMQSRRESSE